MWLFDYNKLYYLAHVEESKKQIKLHKYFPFYVFINIWSNTMV